MTETVLKGTGNSRMIKSVPDFLTLYPNFEAFAKALINGTLPVDIGGLNAAGVSTTGTAFSKATVLPDSVEQAIWGNAANRTPAQALQQLRSLITTAQTTATTAQNAANGKCQVATGSYTGTGTYGVDNPNSISFPFAPVVVMMPAYARLSANQWIVDMSVLTTEYSGLGFSEGQTTVAKKSANGRTLTWYFAGTNGSGASIQYNGRAATYHWVAIG